MLLMFLASAALLRLAWGPLAAGRGGGVTPILGFDHQPPVASATEEQWLPLMLLTHIGGLAVGVESPSVALGAGVPLAARVQSLMRQRPGAGALSLAALLALPALASDGPVSTTVPSRWGLPWPVSPAAPCSPSCGAPWPP
jgi:hypothetical protein